MREDLSMNTVPSAVEILRLGEVRERNLSAVLRCVDDLGVASTAELVEGTGLARSSISKLRAQLLETGLLHEVEVAPTGARGRPTRAVRLADDWAIAVGVDITHEVIRVRALTPSGEPVVTSDADLSAGAPIREAAGRLHEVVRDALADSGCSTRPIALVVALPGIVSGGLLTVTSRGWLREPEALLWEAMPFDARVVHAVNDGASAVTAEVRIGGGRHEPALAVFHGSDGIGGGAFDHGTLISGYGGAAGVFGHTIVEPGGEQCFCGQHGCLERYASVAAITRAVDLDGARTTTLDATAAQIAQRAEAGDPRTLQALTRARHYLERAVAQIGPILCPAEIVLTGNLVPLAPWLQGAAAREDLEPMPGAIWHPPVRGSLLGTESVVLGAAEIARLALLDAPLIWGPST
jgi:predicted NBD/HSP70 family sugar kinase